MTEDKILRTAQYVEGDLNDSERLAFEKLLAKDAELKQHLIDYKELQTTLKMEIAPDINREQLAKTLTTLNKKHFKRRKALPKIVKMSSNFKWLSSAAAILVIGLLIWSPWEGSLYEQYYAAPEMTVTERGADQTDLDKAAALFNDKNYAEAKVILANLVNADPENSLVNYYYGISLAETNELAKGRFLLNELFEGESVFRYDAAYYLAMTYLKTNDKAAAKLWLLKIPEGTAQFVKIQDLLKKL